MSLRPCAGALTLSAFWCCVVSDGCDTCCTSVSDTLYDHTHGVRRYRQYGEEQTVQGGNTERGTTPIRLDYPPSASRMPGRKRKIEGGVLRVKRGARALGAMIPEACECFALTWLGAAIGG